MRSKLTALFISLWIGPKVIKRLQILKFGQEVRNDGPESHFAKKGTPTMGGVMILFSIGVSTLLWANLTNYLYCLVMARLALWMISVKSRVKILMV